MTYKPKNSRKEFKPEHSGNPQGYTVGANDEMYDRIDKYYELFQTIGGKCYFLESFQAFARQHPGIEDDVLWTAKLYHDPKWYKIIDLRLKIPAGYCDMKWTLDEIGDIHHTKFEDLRVERLKDGHR